MIRRYLERHIRRAVAWEDHVADALDLFTPHSSPTWDDNDRAETAAAYDAGFLDMVGIERL